MPGRWIRAWPRPGVSPSLPLAGGLALLIFAYEYWRWFRLQSSAFDLAYFDQLVWNAAAGRGLVSSFASYPFLGQHFSPALLALVPLYWIHPSPLWLLGAQSLALGLALLPLWRLVEVTLGRAQAPVVAGIYALQLFVLRAVDYDFHTEALTVPFVFWALLGAARGRTWVLIVAGMVPMLGKEDGALVSLGIGLVALAVFRRRAGLVLMGLALAYGLVVTVVVMPALRHGAPSDLLLRYGYLGNSVTAILIGMVTRPQVVLEHLLSPAPLAAAGLALGALAFLPLLRPVALLAALPPLLLALLSTHPEQQTLADQYGLQVGPLLLVATLLGWWRLPWRGWAGAVVLVATVAAVLVGAPRPNFDGWGQAQALAPLISQIPASDSVAASDHVLPRVSERQRIGFPGTQADWLLLDRANTPAAVLAAVPGRGYVLAGVSGDFTLWHLRG